MDLINDIKIEKQRGASDAQLQPAMINAGAQLVIDFVMSENSMGLHAPGEATRILGGAINTCRMGQLSLHGAEGSRHPVVG